MRKPPGDQGVFCFVRTDGASMCAFFDVCTVKAAKYIFCRVLLANFARQMLQNNSFAV